MYADFTYLHETVPDLAMIEYRWKMSANAPCTESWQLPAGSSTGDLWRTAANRGVRPVR